MKKNQQIVKVILVASLLFMGGSDLAYAQFGKLKGLVNKAKSEVKNKANDAKNGAVSSATSQASEVAGVSAGESTTGEEKMSNGYPVKWRWEDKNASYYNAFHFQGADTDWDNQIRLWFWQQIMDVIKDDNFFTMTASARNWLDLQGSVGWVPYDEPMRYAYTKNFVDNPTLVNWKYFTYILPYQIPNWYGNYRERMDDYEHGIIDAKNNTMCAWGSDREMQNEQNAREEYALKLAYKKITVQEAAEWAIYNLRYVRDMLSKNSVKIGTLWALYQAMAIKELMVEKHPDYENNKNNEVVRLLFSEWNNPKIFTGEPYKGQFFDVFFAYRNGNVEKKEVPAGVAVDAATKNGGISAGKTSAQNFGEQFVEVIYKEKDWHTFKSPKYPYPITHYSLAISLITKKGDSYIMRNGNLQKTKAGKYQIQIGMDGTASGVPVNYKK